MDYNVERHVGRSQTVRVGLRTGAPIARADARSDTFCRRQSRRNDQLHGTSVARKGIAKVPPINRNQNPDRK